MSDNRAKVKINMNLGELEIEGSEEFVEKALSLESLLTVIKATSIFKTSYKNTNDRIEERVLTSNDDPIISEEEPDRVESNQNTNTKKIHEWFGVSDSELAKVIDITDHSFNIITRGIKGSTADKQKQLCLLYCLTNEYLGKKYSSYDELRDVCTQFACLNTQNFAAYLQKHKQLFVVDGAKGSSNKTVRLTMPGKEEARTIISRLLG